ncbi:MAG: ABC transporter substrate-binding protein [Xanthobacteraceae bacterium]
MAKKSRKKKATPKRKKKPLVTTKTIGVLHTGTRTVFDRLVDDMRQAAADLPSFDVKIKDDGSNGPGHYAEDDIGKLEDDADELVNDSSIRVIIAAGGPQAAIAAMNAADEAGIDKPIVFTTVVDPVGLGLVDDLEFPGRNLTGTAGRTSETDPDRLTLLYRYISPTTVGAKYGVLINPGRQDNRKQYKPLAARAKRHKIELIRARTNNIRGIRRAFRFFKRKNVLGVVVTADSFFNNNRTEVITCAADAEIPTIYQWRQFVEAGGLISYGPKIQDAYLMAGQYAKTILRNENVPKDMACWTPGDETFELVINTNTAKALSLGVPGKIDGKEVKEFPPKPGSPL